MQQVDKTRNVIYCHCMAWIVSYPGIICKVHVCLKWPVQRYGQGLEIITVVWRKRENVWSSLMPLWTSANRGCLAKELLVSLWKAWSVLWSIQHVLQNDPPTSTHTDGPCVKSVECTLCSMTVLVRCFLHQSPIPCCSILQKYEKESENPLLLSSLTFYCFAQLTHLTAAHQDVCCFCLTVFCKYTLFSFLKWR
jgi:hypothetical protein